MSILTAPQAEPSYPVAGHGFAGNLKVAYGVYNLAANPPATTVIQFCKLPAGAIVVGGFLQGADIDTGTEELDIDIGWAANGTELADPDGFGNFGVITGDTSVHLPVAGIYLPLAGVLQSAGTQSFSAETMVQGVVNVDAATGGTGVLKLVVFYVLP